MSGKEFQARSDVKSALNRNPDNKEETGFAVINEEIGKKRERERKQLLRGGVAATAELGLLGARGLRRGLLHRLTTRALLTTGGGSRSGGRSRSRSRRC